MHKFLKYGQQQNNLIITSLGIKQMELIMTSKNFQTCSKDVVGKHEARNLSLMYSPRLAQIRWF